MNAVVHAGLGLAAALAVVNLVVTLAQVTEESPRLARSLFAPASTLTAGPAQPPAASLLTNAGQAGLSLVHPLRTNHTLAPVVPAGGSPGARPRVPG